MMWFLAILLTITIPEIHSRGRLIDPPQRGSLWRYGLSKYINYDDHGLNCGGLTTRKFNDGKCGVCGDAWDKVVPRPHEAGGIYGQGIVARMYRDPEFITVAVDITSYRSGYFEFRLCPMNNPKEIVAQECLDKNLLELKDSTTRYYPMDNGIHFVNVKIPRDIECWQCVLQWKWRTASNWGICQNGTGARGCGSQEEFFNCADIAIRRGDMSNTHIVKLPDMHKSLAASVNNTKDEAPTPNKYFTTLRLQPEEHAKLTSRPAALANLQRETTPHTLHRNCSHILETLSDHWPYVTNIPPNSHNDIMSDTAGLSEFMALGVVKAENEVPTNLPVTAKTETTTEDTSAEVEKSQNNVQHKTTPIESSRQNPEERPEVIVSSVRHFSPMNRMSRKQFHVFTNHPVDLGKYSTTIKRRSISTQKRLPYSTEAPQFSVAYHSVAKDTYASLRTKSSKTPISNEYPKLSESERGNEILDVTSEPFVDVDQTKMDATNPIVIRETPIQKKVKRFTKSPYRSSKYPWFDVKIVTSPTVETISKPHNTNPGLGKINSSGGGKNRFLEKTDSQSTMLRTRRPPSNELVTVKDETVSWLDMMNIDSSTIHVAETLVRATNQPTRIKPSSLESSINEQIVDKSETQTEEPEILPSMKELPKHVTEYLDQLKTTKAEAFTANRPTTTKPHYVFGLGKIAAAAGGDHSVYPAFGWSGDDFTKSSHLESQTGAYRSTTEIDGSTATKDTLQPNDYDTLSFDSNNNIGNNGNFDPSFRRLNNKTSQNENNTKQIKKDIVLPNIAHRNSNNLLLTDMNAQIIFSAATPDESMRSDPVESDFSNEHNWTTTPTIDSSDGNIERNVYNVVNHMKDEDNPSKGADTRSNNYNSISQSPPETHESISKSVTYKTTTTTTGLLPFAAIQGYPFPSNVTHNKSDGFSESTAKSNIDIRLSTDFLMGVNRFTDESVLDIWPGHGTTKTKVAENSVRLAQPSNVNKSSITMTGAIDIDTHQNSLADDSNYKVTNLIENEMSKSEESDFKTSKKEKDNDNFENASSKSHFQASRLSLGSSLHLPVQFQTNSSDKRCNRCYAIGMFRGNAVMDEFCEGSCKFGKCSPCACHCGCPEDILEIRCKPVGLWATFPYMERWCYSNCCNDYCPSTHCLCTFRNQVIH